MTARVRLEDFNTIAAPSQNGNGGKRRLVVVPASKISRERVEWLDPGRVPYGYVTILAGVGGLGKSQWTCLLAAQLSQGAFGEPRATIISTTEDTPSTTVRPRLEAAGADLDLIHFVHITTKEGDEEGLTIPDDVGELTDMVRMFGVGLVVIDPLVGHLPLKIDAHRDQSVRQALNPLFGMAKATGCAVIALLHLNKAEGLSRMSRISGSVGFRNAARSTLFLERDPDDPRGEMGSRRVLIHEKCNLGPERHAQLYEVQPMALEAVGMFPMVETSRLQFLGDAGYVVPGGNDCDTEPDENFWAGRNVA